MANYFFMPAEFDDVPQRDGPQDDTFLFDQGPARGLGKIQFHDFNPVFDRWDLPNVNLFQEQIAIFKEFLMMAKPNKEQQKDVDFLLALGEIFTLVVYGQLILENAEIYEIDPDIVNQIFDFMVRDFAKFALELHNKPSSSAQQMEICIKMLRKPLPDLTQYQRVWEEYVHALDGEFEMNA
jgi:acyl-CoA dehydrogenase